MIAPFLPLFAILALLMGTMPSAQAAAYPGEKYPVTRTRLLRSADLRKWNQAKMQYALDEIYARHGYAFTTKSIRKHFQGYRWYKPQMGLTITDVSSTLSRIEKSNASVLVKAIRAKRAGVSNSGVMTSEIIIGDSTPVRSTKPTRKPRRRRRAVSTDSDLVEVTDVTPSNPRPRRNRARHNTGTVVSNLNPGNDTQGPRPGRGTQRRLSGEKFPITKTKILTDKEIGDMSNSQVRYALNEIYARHGYAFPQPALRKEFSQYTWYKPLTTRSKETVEDSFNRFEAENASLLSQEIDARANADAPQNPPQ